MKLSTLTTVVLGMTICAGTTACFTGVESTPRIDASTVKEQRASEPVAEASYLDDIRPQAPAKWKTGKRFRVADDRISLIFSSPSDASINLVGHDIEYLGREVGTSLTGADATILKFTDGRGRKFYYRPDNYDAARLDSVESLDVPFTIDLDVVEAVDKKMRGRRYYVRTPLWYSADSTFTPISGLRHVEVEIDSIVPGTANFPAAVCFHVADSKNDNEYVLLMGLGKGRGVTRTFDSPFAFENPRKQYPEIKDDVWAMIVCSRVRAGMTRDECRLDLGQPTDILRIPTNGGMQERWTYSDGIYLVFDDGFLTRYRR